MREMQDKALLFLVSITADNCSALPQVGPLGEYRERGRGVRTSSNPDDFRGAALSASVSADPALAPPRERDGPSPAPFLPPPLRPLALPAPLLAYKSWRLRRLRVPSIAASQA